MRWKFLVAVIPLLLSAPFAQADVYKCTDAQGRTVYQQTPCINGQDTGIQTHGNDTMSGSEARGHVKHMLDTAQRLDALNNPVPSSRSSAERSPRSLSVGDRYEVEQLQRKIKHRLSARFYVAQNRAEARELMQEVCAIYDRYPTLRCPYSTGNTGESGNRATVTVPRSPNPIPVNDGRWLYPNDPNANTFTDNEGDHWIRQGTKQPPAKAGGFE